MSDANHNNNMTGIALAFFAFFAFFVSDAIRKILVADYHILDILFWQALIGLSLVVAFALFSRSKNKIFERKGLKWHFIRGVLMAANTGFSLWAISYMPIVDAYTIFFITPFVVTILAALIFKEKIGIYRVLSICGGFIGAFVAFRPGFEAINPAYFIALCCVFTFSSSSLIARKVGQGGGLLAFAFWPFACLFLGLIVYRQGVSDIPNDLVFWVCTMISGAAYALALITIAKSYIVAPASVVAPYQYSQIIFALVFGYVAFGEFPDFYKILGAAIISGSGIFLFYRERVNRLRAKKKAA